MRPLILISNDDGYQSAGIKTLIEALRSIGDLFVVAPDRGRSGAGCSITSDVPVMCVPIRLEEGLKVYACSGTPADCVKLALDQLLVRCPDLVVAGINHGSNASVNIHYSGTVAVTTEAALHGIPSVAFSSLSMDTGADLSHLVGLCGHIARLVLNNEMPYGTFLNVNFPDQISFEGVRVCRMCWSSWIDEFEPCHRSRGGRYYWMQGDNINDEPGEEDTDLWALEHGYVAVTPISVDPTDQRLITTMKAWDL